jgi:hypothetical protein
MSGSNSSGRGATPGAEGIGLPVHAMPLPALDARRQRMGRIKMLLVLLVCAAPVLASYFMYFVVRPDARSNYATLIVPTRTLPALSLRDADGKAVSASALKGQWVLLVVGPADCDAACEKRLFLQRQLREMLGRERDRIDKVWLVTGDDAPAAALRASLGDDPAMHVLQADRAELAAWLAPEPGHALEEHLYLVDPHGEWMLRAPVDAQPGLPTISFAKRSLNA